MNYQISQELFLVENQEGFHTTRLFRDELHQENPRLLLEIYFNDVYKLLLKRLSSVEGDSRTTLEDMEKLDSIFTEFKKVKKILMDLPSADEDGH